MTTIAKMNNQHKNIIEKIWGHHVVKSRKGYPDILAIDLHLLHEVTSPQAFSMLRQRNLKVHAPERTIATVDHNISTAPNRLSLLNNHLKNTASSRNASRNQIETLRKNGTEFGIKLLDVGSGKQGIVHVIGPELGLSQPGLTIVCGDSHTSTHGAFGALAFGIGTTEVGHVLATGCMLQNKPKTMKVCLNGTHGKGITAKDLILKLIQKIGIGGATGHIIEYCGEAVEKLSMEERMTICNMSIECGARAGLIAPDETTYAYIKDKAGAPKSKAKWQEALRFWDSLKSDSLAKYDKIYEMDVSKMASMVTWGTNPAQSMEIDEKIPKPDEDGEDAKKALDYTKLKAGQRIEGTPVDYVFIGSCTNARLSDLRKAAAIFKGRKVAKNVKVYIVPGSEAVRNAAESEGLKDIFEKSGAEFRYPGCSMCIAMNEDKVPKGARCASTSNRNFIGRQGPGSITHLMSPIMAAAAAVTGKITDVRRFVEPSAAEVYRLQ